MLDNSHQTTNLSVTIVTLTYRDFSELNKTIESVFEQDFSEIESVEYVIADDGSENFNKELVDLAVKKHQSNNDTPVKVIIYSNTKNVGTVKSFNKAISISHGDIVVPLSASDEFYDSMAVSSIVKEFKNVAHLL